MTAVMIARITVKDPAKFGEYMKKTQQVAGPFGAEMMFRGKVERPLNGDADHAIVVIAKFPSNEALNDWYDSDAYQPLKALRDEGADMHMTSYTLAA